MAWYRFDVWLEEKQAAHLEAQAYAEALSFEGFVEELLQTIEVTVERESEKEDADDE